jgi:8-oxo-dGTP pyrophosphatase MutT (NUDIX family)
MAKRVAFAGRIFSIVWDEKLGPDGRELIYETVDAPDVVRVYPVSGRSIWLIDEYRHELGADILRTVSGRIEPGESVIQAAQRELREELGIICDDARVFATSQPILKVNSIVHHVIVKPMRFESATPELGERIRPATFPIEALEELVWAGKVIEDVIALQLLRIARNPAELFA